LLSVSRAISDCDFNLNIDFYYKNLTYEYLKEIVDNLRLASELVSRDGVSKHFTDYLSKLSKDLDFLSPGLSWNQIQVIAETKRQEEAQRQAEKRQKENAEADQKRREADRIRQKAEEKQRLAQIAEKERQAKVDEQKRIARLAEEKRLAKLKAEEESQRKLAAAFFPAMIGLIVLCFVIICLGAYFSNEKLVHANNPIYAVIAGAIIGPIAWIEICIVFVLFFLGFIFGQIPLNHDNLALIGLHITILFGTSLTWGIGFWLVLWESLTGTKK
jgi:cation transport ATPase